MSSSTQLYKIKMRIMYAIVYNNLLFLDMFEFSIFGIPSVKHRCIKLDTAMRCGSSSRRETYVSHSQPHKDFISASL
jgi:hypothetical protein